MRMCCRFRSMTRKMRPRSMRNCGCNIATLICVGRKWHTTFACAARWRWPRACSWRRRGSLRLRRPLCLSPHLKARGNFSCPAAFRPVSFTRCRNHRSSSSRFSCVRAWINIFSWPAAIAMKIYARIVSLNLLKSMLKCHSSIGRIFILSLRVS